MASLWTMVKMGYVQNIFSMEDDMERLQPDILVDVDEGMFWSSILHSKTLIKVLKKLPQCPHDLISEWSSIYSSYLKSIVRFKNACFSASEAVRMLPDSNERWNLINDEIHCNIGFRNAQLALVMDLSRWQAKGNVIDIEIMDNYKCTEIDKMVGEFVKACASLNLQNVTNAVNDILLWQNTKTCDYCGKQHKQMYDCIRCKGAGYRNSTCQRLGWSSHKRACRELEKAIQNKTEERQSS
jgi:hypothetical protein